MSKILKNTTQNEIVLTDVGVTIPALTNYTIETTDYSHFAGSSDVAVHISNGNIIINDGNADLGINEGLRLLIGSYPNKNKILGGSDSTEIGNVGDKLKVSSSATGGAIDAFGRQRFSEPSVIFDSYFVETDRSMLFSRKEIGTAAISRNTTERCMDMIVSASGDKAIQQTKTYMHYVPGQSLVPLQTVVMAASQTNLRQRIGYFDDDNGLFFEQISSGIRICERDNGSGSVVDTYVDQANWNLDKLDGTGESGVTLDTTKDNIYVIDFQWLGAGKVRFGLGIDGGYIYFHENDHANKNTRSYMATGNLPIRQEIEALGVITGTPKLKVFCISVMTEGGFDAAPAQRAIDTDGTVNINTSTYTPVAAIRLKASNIRAQLIPKAVTSLATSQDDILFRIYYNPTITGGQWVSAGANSVAEYNITMTSISGGDIVGSGLIAKSGGDISSLEDTFIRIAADIDGNADTYVVAAKSLTSSASLATTITFEELY